ncbi:hypothetical protein M514_05846 [Trichuris suis]|uniref:Uncharacterized protein n=1 Tax=Trichuris suis TaxID=68888 RepID=A0A085MVB6_9BILA|nr:hypothetical protein M514_05846 [Trichuris suis]
MAEDTSIVFDEWNRPRQVGGGELSVIASTRGTCFVSLASRKRSFSDVLDINATKTCSKSNMNSCQSHALYAFIKHSLSSALIPCTYSQARTSIFGTSPQTRADPWPNLLTAADPRPVPACDLRLGQGGVYERAAQSTTDSGVCQLCYVPFCIVALIDSKAFFISSQASQTLQGHIIMGLHSFLMTALLYGQLSAVTPGMYPPRIRRSCCIYFTRYTTFTQYWKLFRKPLSQPPQLVQDVSIF